MPTLINNYYKYSLLAQAAYAGNGGDIDSLKVDADFGSVQASQFLENHRYIDQSDDTTTGFSGTFYEVINGPDAGTIVYALRGTDFSLSSPFEAIQDIMDWGDIALDTAVDQIEDMINFYFRAITPIGHEVKQYSVVVENVVPTLPFVQLPGNNYLVLAQSFTATGLGHIDSNTPLVVTGHSLGGRRFSSKLSLQIKIYAALSAWLSIRCFSGFR